MSKRSASESSADDNDTGFGRPAPLPASFPDPVEGQKRRKCFSSGLLKLNTTPLPRTTFAHDLTKQNRIHAEDLEREGRYDVLQWQPLFLVGALEQPGTLACVLGYRSGLDVVDSMIVGRRVKDDMAGMLVLGRGRQNRRRIQDWYDEYFERDFVYSRGKVDIELADGAVRRLRAGMWVERVGEMEEKRTDSGCDEEIRRGDDTSVPPPKRLREDEDELVDGMGKEVTDGPAQAISGVDW